MLLYAFISSNREALQFGDSDYEEEIETEDALSYQDGSPIVTIDMRSQLAAGIQTVVLDNVAYRSDEKLFGQVVEVKDLLLAREKIITLANEFSIKSSEEVHTRRQYEVAKILFSDRRNISEKELMQAKQSYLRAESEKIVLQSQVHAFKDIARATWGATIAHWLENEDSSYFKSLASQETRLTRFAVPQQNKKEAILSGIEIAPAGSPSDTVFAEYVSEAPNVDLGSGMVNIYFLVKAEFPTGTRLVGSMPTDMNIAQGVFVPNRATVWHSGKPWIYKQLGGDVFSRVEIDARVDLGEGWFEPEALKSGDRVVVSGAQLLLSEELKYQIRNENED